MWWITFLLLREGGCRQDHLLRLLHGAGHMLTLCVHHQHPGDVLRGIHLLHLLPHYRNCTLATITVIGSYDGDRREDGKDGSRGTGQVTRGDRWNTLTPGSSSGSSPPLLLNKADKPQFSATEPAPSILVGGREEIHLPPEKCPALWLFRNHHHPPVLPLLPSSQREQCSKREKNISKTESSTNTTTTATRGSSSSSSRRSRKEEDQDQEEEEDYYSGRSSLSSSTSTATKKETYLRWAGQDVRPVTPPAVGADPGGSSSSHSSSIHTSSSSSSSTPGWSTMGVQGGTDFSKEGGR